MPKLTGRLRLDLVAVRVSAVIIFGAALGFGIWATITRNSALFGRLTALAGVFSLVLAAAVAALGMIVWAGERRHSAPVPEDRQTTQQMAVQRETAVITTTVQDIRADGEASVAARDLYLTQFVHDPAAPPPKPGMLPRDVPDFIGRESEVDRLTALAHAGSARIAVICGSPGIGKTALAIHAAHRLIRGADSFPGGHLYADLLGYTTGRKPMEPGEVLDVFLRRLGVTAADMPADTDDRASLFRQLLESRPALLVLDNAREEWQVEPLLPGPGKSVVFITSREKLPELAVHERITLDVFSDEEADGLLSSLMGQDRAKAEPAQVVKVRDWCGRLPLALWISGQLLATHQFWSVGTLAQKLAQENRLDQLVAGDKEIWAAFAVSYGLLTEQDQRLFRLLGLHPGPQFDATAASSLAGIEPSAGERALDRLSRAHLITEHPAERFGMHDLLRLFAHETCQESDDGATRNEAEARLIAHYARVAGQLAALIDGQPGAAAPPAARGEGMPSSRQEALALLDVERSTLVSTLHLAVGWKSDEAVWQLSASLRAVLRRLHYLDDLSGVLEDALIIAKRAQGWEAICSVLEELGLVCRELRRTDEAIGRYIEARAIRREAGDSKGEALILNDLGAAYQDRGEVETAIDTYREALELCQQAGDPGNTAGIIHNSLGLAHAEQRRHDDAIAAYQRALDLSRETRDHHTAAHALRNLGDTHGATGNLIAAADAYEHARRMLRDARDRRGEAYVLSTLGDTYRKLQQHEEAATSYWAAADIHRDLGDQADAAAVLNRLSHTYREMGALTESAHADEQAQAIRAQIADPAQHMPRPREGTSVVVRERLPNA